MRTLIYKRTHIGDPDPKTGVFGNHDCMGHVRGYPFDAVIGIGGISKEPRLHGIAGRLTWIGIGAIQLSDNPDRSKARAPQVRFRHFVYLEDGPLLEQDYPALASRMYAGKVRYLIHCPGRSADVDGDVEKILCFGKAVQPSHGLAEPNFRVTRVKCKSTFLGGPSTTDC
jgi:hypothetical protein